MGSGRSITAVEGGPYRPRMTDERIELLRRWHDEVADDLRSYGARDVEHLGLRLHVPETVFPPAAMSALLGRVSSRTARPGVNMIMIVIYTLVCLAVRSS